MNRQQVDLHTHSTASDGSLTPTELVRAAGEANLAAIALTDHDSVSGIAEAVAAGEACGIEVIPGVELSTEYAGEEIHVVGLFIDPDNPELTAALRRFVAARDGRNDQIIERLRDMGFSITSEDVYRVNPDTVVARPHIASYLVDTGQVPDVKTVFDRYIGAGKPCYVERYKISPVEAVHLIRTADGLPILAHPCLYHLPRETLLRMIGEMKEAGLVGIEALYSRNKAGDEADYRAIAEQFDLLLSGGSDFHGAPKPDIALGCGTGDLCVPYELLAKMQEYRNRGAC